MIPIEDITRSIRRYANRSALLLALIAVSSLWITLPLSLLSQNTDPLSEQVQEKIWQEIYNKDFHSSKKLVQLELSRSGKNETIPLLSLLEISLNGLERYKQANEIRRKILSIWESKYKKTFLDENYPINLATWTRMVLVKSDSLLIGAEYFIPYPINSSKDGFYFHKFTLYNRFSKKPTRFFKLERSSATNQEYRLYEINADGESKQIKVYGDILPEMKDEMSFLSGFLGI
ncbi:hypothetical protein [Leptospira yasudae]|uniref:Uncharacterized protein n=1 Tax=Leptospira yasudae TaxID=2202201 RepID=A0A6N4R3B5_9LEPT|nr:hypothetical protein [Leptospira yasudae]TGL78367.1 hypothetical protein EHQ77_12500 [Leptospira yasudae]TGL84070.1 hypothetical protein EHQ72_00900 [Leptospira yasudae]TGL84986.1 hypothetical protein EHQ83_09360 [Leptospira yasudae]